MKNVRITNGFTAMTDAKLLLRTNTIVASMTGNTAFPTPNPALSAISATVTAFQAATEAAAGGDKQLIAVRDQLRLTLIDQLHLLGNYVLFTAAGDAVVATSSGFTIGKAAAPRPPITAPQGMVLTNGVNKGDLLMKCKAVPGARSYLHEITPAPLTAQSQWTKVMATTCKNLFTGLASGQEYVCRIAAIGVKNQVAYGQEVSRVVL